jgi:hypothetical protein
MHKGGMAKETIFPVYVCVFAYLPVKERGTKKGAEERMALRPCSVGDVQVLYIYVCVMRDA